MWETHKRDIEMLKMLVTQEKRAVAAHYNLTLRGLDSWLHRIRERRREYQSYVNNILNFEKTRGGRMKKMLLSAQLPKKQEDKIAEFLATANKNEEEDDL